MSYVISVDRDTPITGDELRAITESDPEFSLSDISDDDSAQTFELNWRPDDQAKPTAFILNDGTIDVTTPSNAALQKLQSLAKILGAKVVGEEGEDLSTTEIADVPSQGCGPVAWTATLIAALVIGYWIFN